MATIRVPTAVHGWVYAACDSQCMRPTNARNQYLHCAVWNLMWAEDRELPSDATTYVPVCVSSDIVHTARPAPVLVRICAPHIIEDVVDRGDVVPRTPQGWVNLHGWLDQRFPSGIGKQDLSVALDGSPIQYNRLCCEDVLRIALNTYQEHGPHERLSPDDVMASPDKRRYYDVKVVCQMIERLLAEGKVIGSLDDRFAIAAARADEIAGMVDEIEAKALGPGATPSFESQPYRATMGDNDNGLGACQSSMQVFPPEEPLWPWQEIRRIIGSAQQFVWIEDAYINSEVVDMLAECLPAAVSLRIMGTSERNRFWNGAVASLKRLGPDFAGRVEVGESADVHDRYVYVDGQAWRSSESFKDMAKKRTTKLVPDRENAEALIGDFERRWTEANKVYST